MDTRTDSRRRFLLRVATIFGMTAALAACKTTSKNKKTTGNTGGSY